MNAEPVVASLELGGTKCIAAVSRGATVLEMAQVASGSDPAAVLDALLDRLEVWAVVHRFEAIGIASFGPIALDPAHPRFGQILDTPKPGWSGFDVHRPVADRFALPLALDTDVAGAALAEGLWGAARGCGTYGYLTVGTGIGLGLIVEGRIHHGTLHPEAGHIPVRRVAGDEFAGVCPFHGDCLEGLASGPAIAARAGCDGRDLADDDPVWMRAGAEIGDLMATLILTLAPQRLVIGGGVVTPRPALLTAIRAATVERLSGYVPGLDATTIARLIVAPELVHSGPLGGSALALQMFDEASPGVVPSRSPARGKKPC